MYLLHRPICCQATLSAQSFNGSLLLITNGNREKTLCTSSSIISKRTLCIRVDFLLVSQNRFLKLLRRVLLVPKFFHFGMTEVTSLLGTIVLAAHYSLICGEPSVGCRVKGEFCFYIFNTSIKLAFTAPLSPKHLSACEILSKPSVPAPFASIKECA